MWVLENVLSKGTSWESHLRKGARFIWLDHMPPKRYGESAVRKVDSDPVTRAWGARKGEGPSFSKEVSQ